MMIEFRVSKWNQQVQIHETSGEIMYRCTCPDFTFRHLKTEGEGPEERTIVQGKCKHLDFIFSKMDKEFIQTIREVTHGSQD